MFVLCLLVACAIRANANEKNGIRSVEDYVVSAKLREDALYERRIFDLARNGVRIDVKLVIPSTGDHDVSTEDRDDDRFPEFPVRDIGKCIFEFSLGCVRKRFASFLRTVGRLDEITLLGQDVKLVRSERAAAHSDGRAMRNETDVSIQRTVDDLFDTFILRITLPRWNGKRGSNQIDVMLDETAAAEGRKKGGGGGGGKGGKCRMMMMGMLMLIKMKMIGVAAMKGMMMGGLSLLFAAMMLMQKLGKGGNPWQSGGGGPWQSGGGGHYKEVVLLTKATDGGGHGGHGGDGCCGGGGGHGAPPSSYGAPSGGGGGYGSGGGGWGRSFHKRPMTLFYDRAIKAEPADVSNHTPMIAEVTSNEQGIVYPDYQDYQEPPPIAVSNWNATDYVGLYGYGSSDANAVPTKDSSKVKPTLIVKGRSLVEYSTADVTEKNADSVVTTSTRPDVDVVHATYTDEWQATAEKLSSSDTPNSAVESRVESRRADSRPNDIPLLRDI